MIIASVVFALVCLALVAVVVRSRTKWGRRASQVTSYKRTEAVYVGVVAALAAFLVVFSLQKNTSHSQPAAVTVDVTGYQWCWRFAYERSPVSVTADCVDGHLPTLVLPTGEPIEFHVTSADVIHSMWIPYLRFKLYAYPGYTNSFQAKLPATGTWQGVCAEFCGEYHYAMHFVLRAVTPGQFQAWLQTRKAAGA